MHTSETETLTQQQVDLLVHKLWVAYNAYAIYGRSHPLSLEGTHSFYTVLSELFLALADITIHYEQQILLCEQWRVSPKSFGVRLVSRLRDAHISSLTFKRGIEFVDCREILLALCDAKKYPSVDDLTQALNESSVKGFLFNYITYQKVTRDENVVAKNMSSLVSLLHLDTISSAESVPTQARQADALSGTPDSSSSLLTRIKILREEIVAQTFTQPLSIEEIIQTLGILRESVLEEVRMAIHSGNQTTQIEVVSELEKLTEEITIRIVCEEFRAGNKAPTRLAHITIKLIPDPDSLKRLLPNLKAALLKEGMPLVDYFAYVKELSLIGESDRLSEILATASESVGVTVSELLDEMQRNPEIAVKLILLSSEIQSLPGNSEEKLSEMISGYINSMGSALSGSGSDMQQSESQLSISWLKFEAMMLDSLTEKNLSEKSLSRISSDLSGIQILTTLGENKFGNGGDETTAPEVLVQYKASTFIPDTVGKEGLPASAGSVSTTLQSELAPLLVLAAQTGAHLGSVDKATQSLVCTYLAEFLATAASSTDLQKGSLEGGTEFDGMVSIFVDNLAKELASHGIEESRIRALTDHLVHTLTKLRHEQSGFFDEAPNHNSIKKGISLQNAFVYLAHHTSKDSKNSEIVLHNQNGSGSLGTLASVLTFAASMGSTMHPVEASSWDAIPAHVWKEVAATNESLDAKVDVRPASKNSIRQDRIQMPKMVQKSKEFQVEIDREIKRHRRYQTPFAAIGLTYVMTEGESELKSVSEDIRALLFPKVSAVIADHFRDLDKAGMLGTTVSGNFCVLLPMTSQRGATIAHERLYPSLQEVSAQAISGVFCKPISVLVLYDGSISPDAASFTSEIKKKLRAGIKKANAKVNHD